MGELPEPSSTRKRRVQGLFIRLKDTAARIHFVRTRSCPLDYWYGIAGHCLRPYLIDGDAVLIDFDREPVDGDFVLVSMAYQRRSLTMIGADAPEIREHEAVKLLRVAADGSRHLCAADGSVSADAHKVMGTVVGWYRPGWWRRPSPKRMRLAVPAAAPAELEHAS